MGLLRDSEDSVSACSKRTYLTARSRARPSVITCSSSTLRGGDRQCYCVSPRVRDCVCVSSPGELLRPHGAGRVGSFYDSRAVSPQRLGREAGMGMDQGQPQRLDEHKASLGYIKL